MKTYKKVDFADPQNRHRFGFLQQLEQADLEKRADMVQDRAAFCEVNKEVLIASDVYELFEKELIAGIVRDNCLQEVCILEVNGKDILFLPNDCSYADFQKVFTELTI